MKYNVRGLHGVWCPLFPLVISKATFECCSRHLPYSLSLTQSTQPQPLLNPAEKHSGILWQTWARGGKTFLFFRKTNFLFSKNNFVSEKTLIFEKSSKIILFWKKRKSEKFRKKIEWQAWSTIHLCVSVSRSYDYDSTQNDHHACLSFHFMFFISRSGHTVKNRILVHNTTS